MIGRSWIFLYAEGRRENPPPNQSMLFCQLCVLGQLGSIHGNHQLYDLAEDPEETVNHFGEEKYAAVQQALFEALEAAYAQYTIPPFDGSKTMPTGSGQLNEIKEEGENVFHPQILYFRDLNKQQ